MSASDGRIIRIEGPLPVLASGDAPVHFREFCQAQAQYEAHRSANAPADTQTFHLLIHGEVSGFTAWRVGVENLGDEVVLYVSVEYIYVNREYRDHRMSTVLLGPLIKHVRGQIVQAARACPEGDIRICSTNVPTSGSGGRLLQAVERRLARVASPLPGVTMVGRYCEHPPKASQSHRATTALGLLSEAQL